MVCKACEAKQRALPTTDPFKNKTSKLTGQSSKVRVADNKLLSKAKYTPYQKFEKCLTCKQTCHMPHHKYCQTCAYKRGICSMCGVAIADTSSYKQSVV
ncbi:hypothetical protein CAOG_02980 [Capsaspora owczarzaki ATCC 30864]|uniref:Cysteine-rich PDZ-binding protein n=1 Tax=Capsaspora owczarzaki (strain ATCC 30864) TaxID=595528 RepID=A0A0D2WMA5_CAPO3|nr:hypothetical protein CAOG_02980 [Capsaspora owczarzaki ATCC 30864]KJE91925.1 hypothetical protein CAOG_002980 [Capsaspora owczarzaki ATCC 30864]|eukprot:XP_004363819.1 hypothetical protein CAOG_02980 [Capsaspora owczarzaki ATCC 30864]